MKILILSDIHANWYALEAILDKESYDALIFLGDVVDFGPSPRDCIKFLMNSSKGRFWGVRGDHAMAGVHIIICEYALYGYLGYLYHDLPKLELDLQLHP